MGNSASKSRRFCFISITEESYLVNYVDLSRDDSNMDFSFDSIDFNKMEEYNPNIIIIDQYFCNKSCTLVLEAIKQNFNTATIYFLSPEYTNYNGVMQSENNENHYFSNFNTDILNHINNSPNKNRNYLEAS